MFDKVFCSLVAFDTKMSNTYPTPHDSNKNPVWQIRQLRAKSSISLSPTLTGLALVPATRVHPLPGHVSCISFGCVKGLDQRLRTSLNSSIGGWAPYFSCAVGIVARKSKPRKYVEQAAVKFGLMNCLHFRE